MSKKRVLAPGEYYHVYNRGVEKRGVFMDEADYKRFVALLYLCNSDKDVHVQALKEEGLGVYEVDRKKTIVSVGAYCLMPNHFHLLLKENTEGGLVKFLQKLCTAYAMYFNKKNKRVGPLFQGRFKAEHVNTDEYLKYLYAYIHLNPIKRVDEIGWGVQSIVKIKEAEEYLMGFDYSSYKDFAGVDRPESRILSRTDFPGYFESHAKFKMMMKEWVSFKPRP